MIWFPTLLFAILIFIGCTYVQTKELDMRFFFASVATAVAASLVCFLYGFIKNTMPLTGSVSGIYFHYLVHDHIFFFYPGVIAALLCMRLAPSDFKGNSLAKGFVLIALFDLVATLGKFYYCKHSWWGDPYLVFVLPFFMLLGCILFAFSRREGAGKVDLLCVVLFPFVAAAVSAFYYANMVLLAYIAVAVCYAPAAVCALFFLKRRSGT